MRTTAKIVITDNKIQQLLKAASSDTLERAVMAGAQVIEANARINANRVFSSRATNTLAGSISSVITESSGTSASADIGPTVIYGRIQELGGVIKPVIAKMLSWVSEGGERIFAHSVTLPPRPYLRPAVDENLDAIRDAIAETIRRDMESAL